MSIDITPSLQNYIEQEIIPRYDKFDPAHRRDHALTVIGQSLRLARHYPVNTDMVYTIAAYHDTGLCLDRATHHLVSGEIVRTDNTLKQWFDADEIETMAQAVEDHRASSDHTPRSIYGKIVAEADRLIDADTIISRTIQYGLTHYPTLTADEQTIRAASHLKTKYGKGGYLKLWIPESDNARRLAALQTLIDNETELLNTIRKEYNKIANEKI